MQQDLASFFSEHVAQVAQSLIGARLLIEGVGGIITETEAYHPDEPASHAHRGPTQRNRAMFLGPAHLYVYRSYGLHWCLNFVCADGAAVLVRALEPTEGIPAMMARRGLDEARQLCSGPGKLCAALGVTDRFDGLALPDPAITLELGAATPEVHVGPRIGITKAAELPWRFGLAGSRFLSRSFPRR